MKKSILTLIIITIFLAFGCKNKNSSQEKGEQENQIEIENSDGNTIIQVNLKIENIETDAPITNGSIVLVIDGKTIEESLNSQGLASLSMSKSFENKNARLIVKDSEGNEQYSQNYIIKETETEPKKISIQPFKRFVVDEINGQIAEGAANEYTFQAEPNYPILIQVRSNGNLSYYLQILNSATEVIVKEGIFNKSATFHNIPFTAPKKDIYTIKVIGYRNEGNYTINVVYIDSENDEVDSKLALIEQQQHYDKIGKGSYDSYLFKGVPNNTVVIQSKSNGNLSYYVQLYNSIGERIINEGTFRQSEKYYNIPFTPKDSGEYEIRILGYRGFGSYDVKYYSLEAPVYEQVEFGKIKSATLGEGAYHEYQFVGIRNQSIRIKTMGKSDLNYYVQIYNASGEQLLNAGTYGRSVKYIDNLFTAKKDGDYIVRILGYRDFGEYKILLEEV